MKKILFVAIMILLFLLSSCKGTKTASSGKVIKKDGVTFVKSPTLTAVLEKATSENKLVFVDFYTTWCLPCKMMDEDVFPDKNIGDFMNDNFISYKVNGEKGNGVNLVTVFDVQLYPTIMFLDQNGRVLERKEGAAYHTELKEMAERALASIE